MKFKPLLKFFCGMSNVFIYEEIFQTEKYILGKVVINNLSTGVVLGADVCDRSGRLLLRAGTELDEKNIYILRTWGVVEVEVAGAENDSMGSKSICHTDPVLFAAIEKKVAPLFRNSNLNHPAIKELLQMRIIREAENVDH